MIIQCLDRIIEEWEESKRDGTWKASIVKERLHDVVNGEGRIESCKS